MQTEEIRFGNMFFMLRKLFKPSLMKFPENRMVKKSDFFQNYVTRPEISIFHEPERKKQSALEQKNREIQLLKEQLHEKDKELSRAKERISELEEEIKK